MSNEDRGGDPNRSPTTLTLNLCSRPSWAIASPEFNRNPEQLEIQGVRRAHRFLFQRLDGISDPVERSHCFHDYMDVAFNLHEWEKESSEKGRKSLKNSYARFLRGWMFDSNSIEGAVLKGWVESRMGIPPTFHAVQITNVQSDAYFGYASDRMKGSARTNAIFAQLDVLYEFCQYELRRREGDRVTYRLYRGVHDFAEHQIRKQLDKKRCVVRLNNLASFTNEFETAWEFGTKVLEADVPQSKIFFRPDLLPGSLLKGEGEFMVIGGDYEVVVRAY